MARSPRIPKYRRHSSGQARVTLDGKDHLLGPYGTAASKEAYDGSSPSGCASLPGRLAPRRKRPTAHRQRVILAYWKIRPKLLRLRHRQAPRRLATACGTPSASCGPSTAARPPGTSARWPSRLAGSKMIDDGLVAQLRQRPGRPHSAHVPLGRRGGVAAGSRLPGSAQRGRPARGKTEARETEKVRPVPQEHIDAALPFMPPVVAGMVRLQLLTGCRPDEVCRLRPMDLDTQNPAVLDLPAGQRPGGPRQAQDRPPRPRSAHPARPKGPERAGALSGH